MRWLLLIPVCSTLMGCLDSDTERGTMRNRPVETPKISEASVECASRVDQVGRLLVSQNPFLGLEPIFQTFGIAEPEIWHPDFHAVFISEGLVKQCATDEELAAVLANELAKMVEEQRAAANFRKVEPMQLPQESSLPGSIASHSHDLGINALADKKQGQMKRPAASEKQIDERTAEILKSAGYDTKPIPQVKDLLKEARRNRTLAKQFGDRGDKPNWSR